jgi:hypothetical protein
LARTFSRSVAWRFTVRCPNESRTMSNVTDKTKAVMTPKAL